MNICNIFLSLALLTACSNSNNHVADSGMVANEQHRPQVHFTPEANWMNDPNGMVFYNNQYHLFYQYYPGAPVWGPMHWGHATSTDLVHWQHQPVALYPDSVGYVFSGSAVVDENNTSGLGKNGKPPLVAIYTSHSKKTEDEGRNDFQNQSLAYSNDEGKTWSKYASNPVLKNPGIKDFRDPKVCWYDAGKKWIMTLATQDCISFYSSPDLKNWVRESEFGKQVGAHGGVWECPDLFQLPLDGKQYWVLLVSLNPGGPNKGSGTQYFIGDFDGKKFTPADTKTRWLDYGPDNYAGVTWSNTGDRKIFVGWMSNWLYASTVPTVKWRSATTVPRELQLKKQADEILVSSKPVAEFSNLNLTTNHYEKLTRTTFNLIPQNEIMNYPARLNMKGQDIDDFFFTISNKDGQKVVVGYDKKANHYFIDRISSGKVSFHKEFAARATAPRISKAKAFDLELVLDKSSVELFADNGLSVMTALYFPDTDYSKLVLQSSSSINIQSLDFTPLKSIYR